jgi:hypothetical protein
MDAPNGPMGHDDLLRRFLESTSAACPVCAYDLRGLTSTNCPECGAALELRVGSSDLRLGLWLIALFGVVLPFGFFAIFLALAVVMSIIEPYGGPPPLIWLSLIGGAVGFGLATLTLIRVRRWYWRKRRAYQARLAGWLWAVSIAATIGLIIAMFTW